MKLYCLIGVMILAANALSSTCYLETMDIPENWPALKAKIHTLYSQRDFQDLPHIEPQFANTLRRVCLFKALDSGLQALFSLTFAIYQADDKTLAAVSNAFTAYKNGDGHTCRLLCKPFLNSPQTAHATMSKEEYCSQVLHMSFAQFIEEEEEFFKHYNLSNDRYNFARYGYTSAALAE